MTTTTTASTSTRNAALWIDTDGTIGVGDIGFLIESTDNNRRGAVKYRLDSEPRCTNQSLQPRLTGWCGETNNVSVYAMGLRRVSKLTKDGRALLARLTDAERDEWLRANGYESLIPLQRIAQLRPVPSREGRAFRRMSGQPGAIANRRTRAVESFRTAAECIGPVVPGISIFAITRGQFSMIDAVLHVLAAVECATLSIWTWTIADYEIEVFGQLASSGRIAHGTLVIDSGAKLKNAALIAGWKRRFGANSVRYVLNHAKIAMVEGAIDGQPVKFLLRGSMNLNMNPRFEQLDVTEGGPDFDLVKQIQDELPILPDTCTQADTYKASKVSEAFDKAQLDMFAGLSKKVWAK